MTDRNAHTQALEAATAAATAYCTLVVQDDKTGHMREMTAHAVDAYMQALLSSPQTRDRMQEAYDANLLPDRDAEGNYTGKDVRPKAMGAAISALLLMAKGE